MMNTFELLLPSIGKSLFFATWPIVRVKYRSICDNFCHLDAKEMLQNESPLLSQYPLLREPIVPLLNPSKRCFSERRGRTGNAVAHCHAKRPENVYEFIQAAVNPPMSQ